MVDNNPPIFDYAFTELFSHLKNISVTEEGRLVMAYPTETLKLLINHSNNAIETLLRCLQSLGLYLSILGKYAYLKEEFGNIGTLISTLGNLIEALNILNADIIYELSERNERQYEFKKENL